MADASVAGGGSTIDSAAAAGVVVLHGPSGAPIAARLAMDLRSDGIEARACALARIDAAGWQARLPGVTALVVVYDGRTWLEDSVVNALRDMHPERPVVFVRSRTSRFAPEFDRFFVVPLFDGDVFSHYQPYGSHRGGYATVIEFLGGGRPARGPRRRGFAFLSYSGNDRLTVNERLVPALAANDFGFFDYRFTARLDGKRLFTEIETRIERCAVVVMYASSSWARSTYTRFERDRAFALGRPIVAVRPPAGVMDIDFPAVVSEFGPSAEGDAASVRAAVDEAVSCSGSRP